jgi:hypothetical protein
VVLGSLSLFNSREARAIIHLSFSIRPEGAGRALREWKMKN